MMVPPPLWKTAAVLVVVVTVVVVAGGVTDAAPARRILLDADMDKDDFFALFYILKQNRSEFELKVGYFIFFSVHTLNSFSHGSSP
ncbi:hypothetical protein PR202_gb01033 [Eleusine coracana subsp. coracana]|uniref:Uncharacterized protein n=1 Tax=Eleusine coracana subsp. coracana TaxID=191504 RepID=A0AAV5DVJ3_ELECO|nr:hypothetical protein PR202_gb01033 [Eleusine coracana subsp. coracana]